MPKGLDAVLANLSKEVNRIEGATLAGLIAGAQEVEAEAVEMTPSDHGVLKNTSTTVWEMQGTKAVARVLYTAKYAAAVHEFPMKLKGQPRAHFGRTSNKSKFGPQKPVPFGKGTGRGTYWDVGENKFLEKSFKQNHKFILAAVAKRAKIK